MKIILVILINLFFGFIGYYYKTKIKKEKEYLKQVNDFLLCYESNITLFKNNIHEIINNYIIMQKNKNAKHSKLFLNIDNKYQIDDKFLDEYVQTKDTKMMILNYFSNIGNSEYLHEKEKILSLKNILNERVKLLELEYKNKGELFFKIMIAIGLILSILIW